MKKVLLLMGIWLLLLTTVSFAAAIPKLVNYQAMLADSAGNPLTGSYSLIFRVYDDSTGGNLEWTESQNGIEVVNGLFNVTLGAAVVLNLPFDESYWLEVEVNGEIMPRMRFTSVGYAYRSLVADQAIVADSARVAGIAIDTTGGDVTAVGSMTSGDAFADSTADNDWLGLGAAAGRIEFDDQATDEVNILDANVGIGTATPDSTKLLHIAGDARIDGDLHMGGALTHDSPVQVKDGLEFVDSTGAPVFHIELEGTESHPGETMPATLKGALLFETHDVQNASNMEIVFWDNTNSRPALIISEGGPQRASTFDRSLQIGKALGAAPVDSSYTRFEGFNYIDGSTSGTGADLGVEDDIEAKGSIYSQENVFAEGGELVAGKDTATYAGRLVLHDADGTDGFTTTIVSNADVAASFSLTLPADDGLTDQVLTTDGSGALNWTTPTGTGDITAVGDATSAEAFTEDGAGNVLYFEGATADSFEIALQGADAGTDVTLTLPEATDILVGRATTDTLSNKTLVSAALDTKVSGSAVLDEDDMVSDSDSSLATQQSIKAYVDNQVVGGDFADTTFSIYDDADSSKILAIETGGITTGNTRILSVPDYDGIIATVAGTETLTNKTLTAPTIDTLVLNAAVSGTAVLDEDDMASDDPTKLATQQSVKAYVDNQAAAGDFVDSTFTIYDNADSTKILTFETSGISSDSTTILSVPDYDGTIATLAGTETLTNKTLTSPTIDILVLNGAVSGNAVLDEDDMASDDFTKLATQQSIKAYVDTKAAGGDFVDSTFSIYDDADSTKKLAFETSGISSDSTTTLSVPDYDGTIATLAGTETLTNKTLTSPTIDTLVLNAAVSGNAVLDEDDMASDDSTKLATQQSIKAYVDNQAAAGDFVDSTFTIYDNADSTKKLAFETSGITADSTTTLSIPDYDGTIATLAGTETLTNKTLTAPTIDTLILNAAVSGSAVLDEDDMASDDSTKLATQQSIKAYVDNQAAAGDFVDSTFSIYDNADSTRILTFETSGISSDSTTTLSVPDYDGTIATLAGTETLTNKTLTSPVLNSDVSGTAVLDEDDMASDDSTKLVTQQSIKAYVDNQATAGDFVDSTFTIYDNADSTKILTFETSGISSDSTTTLSVPDFDGTIATLAGTETLTNKTLISPVLNTDVSGTAVLDEDDMASDDPTKLATQQSVKAYVDNQAAAGDFVDSTFTIYDNADSTRILTFETSGISSDSTTTLSVPDYDGTIATLAGTETLTNKTLTSPVLNSDVSGTAVLDEDDMASDDSTKLVTQQSIKAYVDTKAAGGDFVDSTFSIYDDADSTKILTFETSGISSDSTTTLSVPDYDGTIATLAGAEILTNKTLTAPTIDTLVLNAAVSGTAVLDEDDMVSDDSTKLATQQSIKAYVDNQAAAGDFIDSTFSIFDNGDSTKILTFETSGISSDSTTILSVPDYDGTIATIEGTETLTNKTLTAPIIDTLILNAAVSGTAVLDEDDMASDDSTKLATQQSIKAYVDNQAAAGDFVDSTFTIFDNGDSTKILTFETSGISSDSTTILSVPDYDGTIATVAGTETLTNKTLTAPTIDTLVLNAAVSGTAVLDEDDMASDDSTKLATQQSIKAYVDSTITKVGSMTSGDAFAGSTADDDWLGLGAAAGRIAFNDTTTDVISFLNANVGIGTTTPTQSLEVAGNVKISDTLFSSNVSSNSPLSLQTAGTTRVYIDDGTGNVGIGTTSPGSKLEVKGATDDLSAAALNATDSAGTSLLYVRNDGRVGIGTTAPLAPLTVKSTTAGNAKAFTIENNLGNEIYTFWAASSSENALTYMNNGSGVTKIQLASSGVSYFDAGNFGIGTTSPGSKLEVKGTTDDNTAAALNATDSAGTSLIYARNDGNVGIGTSSPSRKLTIEDNGDTLFFSHDGSNALFESWGNFLMKDISTGNALTTVTIEGNGSGNAELKIKDGQYSGSYTSLIQFNQTFEIDYGSSGTTTDLFNINPDGQDVDVQFEGTTEANLLFLDAGTDNVGIGTGSPGSRLEVKGTTDDNTAAALNATDSAGTSLMYVRNDGNVGIGTTAPDQKLSVSDTSSMTQAIFGQDRTTGYSQIIIGEKAAADSAFSIGYDHDNNYGFMQVAGDAVGAGLVVADGGNVGIGTATPEQKLEVNGSVIAKTGFANRLWDVAGGHYETAIAGVEYYSPEQHGGFFGTVYRKYFVVPDGGGNGGEVYIDLGVTPVCALDVSGFLYRFNEGFNMYMIGTGETNSNSYVSNQVVVYGSTMRIDPSDNFDIQGGYCWIDYSRL